MASSLPAEELGGKQVANGKKDQHGEPGSKMVRIHKSAGHSAYRTELLPAENPRTPAQVLEQTENSQKASHDNEEADEAIDLRTLAKLIDHQKVDRGVSKQEPQGVTSRGGCQATGEKDRWQLGFGGR